MIAGLREDAWLRLNPCHPGEFVGIHMENEGVGVSAAASRLGVTRAALSRLIRGQSRISPDMALRLEAQGWGTADHWGRKQWLYDLAQVRKQAKAA